MKLAIVHYHMRPGGVREVLLQESRLLAAAGVEHVILVGDPAEVPADVPVRRVEGLDYAPPGNVLAAESLGERMMSEARCSLGGRPDAWHFHNHALGKNPVLPRVVAAWAVRGERMLLQTHDRVERGRPDLYAAVADFPGMHPHAPHVHHAFLNRGDLTDFVRAGLPRERAHWLPNPVEDRWRGLPPVEPGRDPLLWVPMRAIRRKNPGEWLLLAAMLPPGGRLAVSRAPRDTASLRSQKRWAALARRFDLPLDFAVADRLRAPAAAGRGGASFEEWCARSTHWLSTSVEEGFGMVFGEAMTAGRSVMGRYLQQVCADHHELGIRSGPLYERVCVPADWVDRPALRARLECAMAAMWRAYGRDCPAGMARLAEERLFRDGGEIDFADLPQDMQRAVIRRVLAPGGKALTWTVAPDGGRQPLEDWLRNALNVAAPVAAMPEACSGLAWWNRFSRIMQSLGSPPATSASCEWVDFEALLDQELQAERFRFLLSPDHGDPA